MRKIRVGSLVTFFILFGAILVLGITTAYLLLSYLPLGDFRGVTIVVGSMVLIFGYGIVVYRACLRVMPLREGMLAEGTREEFAAHLNMCFYFILFNSLIRTRFLPVPLMRLVYLALGARLGDNTYVGGTLLDPPLTELGANCIVGHDAVLYCHAIEGSQFSHARIRIADNVTIGAMSVVMSGVRIGEGAIVAAGAVVLKDTQIGPKEVWGGVPAKRLK